MMREEFMLHKKILRTARFAIVVISVVTFWSHVAMASMQENAKPKSSKPQISIRADRTSVQIADPLEVIIKATASNEASVQFPAVPQQLGPFEVIDHRDLLGVPSESNDGTSTWTRRITVETLETGKLQIPPIEVVVRTPDQPPLRLVNAPLSIDVASVLEPASDPAKFADIQDLIDVPEPTGGSYQWIVWAAAGGIGLAALAAGALFVFRGRTNWTTPADWAIAEIADLNPNSSQSFARLEQIVRTYIEEEFHVPATSYSPRELQKELVQIGASENNSLRLGEFLAKAEQTKYAGLTVSDTEYASAKATVLDVVGSLNRIPENNGNKNNTDASSMEVA